MTYSSNFVAAIRINQKTLRETAGTVVIPFGSEFQIYLKNLSSVRAQAKVEIDGTDVTEGTWLVINPNSSLDLERFIKNGNWNSGNRFKFIKRTGRIEEHRGIKAEDGLVRIEYKFEKQPDPEVHTHHYDHYHYNYDHYWAYYPWGYWNTPYTVNNSGSLPNSILRSKGGVRGSSLGGVQSNAFNLSKCATPPSATNCSTMSSSNSLGAAGDEYREASLDPGITVEGSQSNQQFYEAGYFPTEEQSHIIVLKLMGTKGGKQVLKAITVKTKTKCHTCGTTNKSGVKFCRECGTSLELV
jgi:hypothetical protein